MSFIPNICFLNNNLTPVDYPQSSFTFNSLIVSAIRSFNCKKVGNEVILDMALTITDVGTVITSLPVALRPLSSLNGYGIDYDGSVGGTVIALITVNAGGIIATTWTTAKPYLTASIRWRIDM